ncbi:MAG: GNAT family N-acetyltransferase [Ignavibacteriaceae bacterium]|nr:GNAT family N-acetyltransferase [Ignavibacteriaceae bacterium]
MNIIYKHVNPKSMEALELTNKLFFELDAIYPKSILENFVEENSLMKIFIIAFSESSKAIAAGALKHYSQGTVEVKRMFVLKEYRGQGISARILSELEKTAREMNYKRIILETGTKQPEALGLYRKFGYTEIECYGRHSDDPTSVCFEKTIT